MMDSTFLLDLARRKFDENAWKKSLPFSIHLLHLSYSFLPPKLPFVYGGVKNDMYTSIDTEGVKPESTVFSSSNKPHTQQLGSLALE